MFWWVPAAGAALGAYLGHQQQKAQDEARKVDAMANMYAPLFGKGPTSLGPRQDLTTPAAISGAINAYGIASQLKAPANSADPNSSSLVPYGQALAQSTGTPQSSVYDYYYGRQNPYSLGGG